MKTTKARLEELLNNCIAHIMELESPSDYNGTFKNCLGFTEEEMVYFEIIGKPKTTSARDMKISKFADSLKEALDADAGYLGSSVTWKECHLIAILIDGAGQGKDWGYSDFHDLAKSIRAEDNNWLYVLSEYDVDVPDDCELYTAKEYLKLYGITVDDNVKITSCGDIDDIIDASFVLEKDHLSQEDIEKAKDQFDDYDLSESPTAQYWHFCLEDIDPDDDGCYALITDIPDSDSVFYEFPED